MKKSFIIMILLMITTFLWSEDLRISQIDTNSLMFSGGIDIYFSLPGASPDELRIEDFMVTETNAGQLKITGFEKKPNRKSPIDFILLIDNSGSMYEENFNGKRRIDQAMFALDVFLDRIEASGDNAAVYTFNTLFEEIAPLGTPVADIRRSLPLISRPDSDLAYTELYSSLASAAAAFPKTAGRHAVIVLSDGENFPVSGRTEGSPDSTKADPEHIIRLYHETGVTLDGINISDNRDMSLEDICDESGGGFYDVRTTEAIAGVYSEIREKIQNEYLITVSAPPLQNNIGELRLSRDNSSDTRMLMVPMLFGGTSDAPAVISLLILVFCAGIIAALFIIPFERPVRSPQIQGLDSSRRTILNEGTTIIGAARDAHFTLAGSPGVEPEHATIIRDVTTGQFTLVSKKPVRVNNRKVKTRKLNPGDVIRIEGSTIIFDEPQDTKQR